MKKQLLKLTMFMAMTAPITAFAQTQSNPATQGAATATTTLPEKPSQITPANQRLLDAYHVSKALTQANIEAHTAARVYRIKYNGNQAVEDSLVKVFLNYSTESEMIFSKYQGQDVQTKLAALILKTDSLKQMYLGRLTQPTAYNSKFSDALRYATVMKFTPDQVAQLKTEAAKLSEQRRQFLLTHQAIDFDPKPAEAKIATILTEEQYHSYLLSKNKPQAVKWATGDWANMKARGIATGDSAQVVLNIMTYDMRKLAANEQYANDPVKLSLNLAEIEKAMPEELKTLRYNVAHGNSTTASSTQSSFKW
jgi:hypothetical protein